MKSADAQSRLEKTAEHHHGEGRGKQEEPGPERYPPRHEDEVLALLQYRAPVRSRRRDTEPEEAERGLDAHPEDAVLAFYVATMDGICSAGAPYDGAIELGEK